MIDITGIPKHILVQHLYLRAGPQGLGFLQYTPTPLSDDEAMRLCDPHPRWMVDYVKGRSIKCKINQNPMSPVAYDRDNGPGACAEAVASARRAMGSK